MLPTTVPQVQDAFQAAKNLNAALKNFIKREGGNGAQVVSFAKDFRAAVSTGRAPAVTFFIEKNYPAKQVFFLGVARYAVPELVETSVGRIIEKHAEAFNTTYQRGENGITVTDAAQFKKIVRDVLAMIKEDIKAAGLTENPFLENALLASVFEVEVLAEVMKVVE
jgi:hypothetical protein